MLYSLELTLYRYRYLLQCWGSVTFWCESSGSPDPYLWLMDPTSFSLILRMQINNVFSHFFLITCPQVHHLQFKKCNSLLKFCVKMLFCSHYFSPLNTFMRKGKDPDPHLWLLDPGGPNKRGSCGSGSPTLIYYLSGSNTVSLCEAYSYLESGTPHSQSCGSGSGMMYLFSPIRNELFQADYNFLAQKKENKYTETGVS